MALAFWPHADFAPTGTIMATSLFVSVFAGFITVLDWLRSVLLPWLQPALVPCCFILAWGLLFLLAAQLWALGRDGVRVTQRLHQIPCANCQFFTGDYHLKCTVNPSTAMTELAIGCRDFNHDLG
jgi:hypothetical protein